MSYCTLANVETVIPKQELINLTVDEPDIDSTVNEAIFNECTNAADSLINGYLRIRYTLPLKTVPAFLCTIATDITAYRLHLRRPRTIPEHIQKNYESALKQLLALKKGDILLETPAEDNAMPKVKSSFRTNKTVKDRIFGDCVMKGFRNQ